MTLLFVAPAMFVLSRRRYYALAASLALATSLLPDLDGPLPLTHHHGGTHTVAFALGFSLAVGLALAAISASVSWLALRFSSVPAFRPRSAFALGAGGSLAGLGSHLVGDMLPIPIGDNPVKPLWPLSDAVVALGLIHPGDPAWNWGLLAAGIAAQALAFAFTRSHGRLTITKSSG